MKSYQRPKKNSSTHWSLYDDAFSFLRSPVARVSGEPVVIPKRRLHRRERQLLPLQSLLLLLLHDLQSTNLSPKTPEISRLPIISVIFQGKKKVRFEALLGVLKNWGFSVREKRKKCEAQLSEIEKRN